MANEKFEKHFINEKCPVCGKEMTIWEKDIQKSDGFYNHDVPFWYCLNCKQYHGMVNK